MVRGETQDALADRAKETIPGGVNSYARRFDKELNFSRGQGSKIVDSTGREYVDFLNAWGAIVLGHCDPRVVDAVDEASRTGDLFGYGASEFEVELAETIERLVPSAEMSLFGVAGTEVVAHGLRLARNVTSGSKIVKFQGHYHGWYDPVALNQISDPDDIGTRDPYGAGIREESQEDTIVLPFNDRDAVTETFEEHGDDIAVVILEPVVHNMGCVTPNDGYLEFLRSITAEHDTLLFFDEIITGFRHGLSGVQGREGVTPDLTTLGKSIANGYPVSVLCGKEEYMTEFQTAGGDVQFGGTYNGHVASMAAANRTVELLESNDVPEQLEATAEQLSDAIGDLMEDSSLNGHVRQYGSVFLTYFTDPPFDRYADVVRNDTETYQSYRRAMIENGVLMVTSDVRRNYVSAAHDEADVEETIEAAKDAIATVEDQQ